MCHPPNDAVIFNRSTLKRRSAVRRDLPSTRKEDGRGVYAEGEGASSLLAYRASSVITSRGVNEAVMGSVKASTAGRPEVRQVLVGT